MAWNRTTEQHAPKAVKASHGILHGTLAVAVIAIGSACAWFALKTEPSSKTSHEGDAKGNRVIKEQKPVGAPKKSEPEPPKVKLLTPEEACAASVKDKNGFPCIVTDMNGKKWYRGAEVPEVKVGTARRNGKPWGHREYFKRAADNILTKMFVNGLATGPSSAPDIRNDRYFAMLERSLHEKAEIVGEESEDARDVAQQLEEVKAMIADKMAAGAKLQDIISEAKSDQEKVIAARKNYADLYREKMKNGASPQELDELLRAANQILKENFGAPLKHAPSVEGKLRGAKLKAERTQE